MRYKVDDCHQHQNDEPGGPGMQLVPMRMLVPGEDRKNEEIDCRHVIVPYARLNSFYCDGTLVPVNPDAGLQGHGYQVLARFDRTARPRLVRASWPLFG
jgi:hypothetical protein